VIYHLALEADWSQAQAGTSGYRIASIGRSLGEVGFIHCSFENQLRRVADAYYRGRTDVVLLSIDESKLTSPIREENTEGGTELFPHIYGPLNVDAVLWARPLAPNPDGTLEIGV
jgi:glutathione S-transferase